MVKRILSLSVIVCFFLTSLGPLPKAHADSVLGLPAPGTMVNLSPAYEPVIIKGLTVHKDNPFLFDFIVDVGQDRMSGEPLKKEGEKLIKYFLASLAIPDKDVWVNLSPYEKNRMIPDALGQTDMGRDLLEQDYILKQITASLIYPEKQLGKTFWDKVYAKSQEMYGTTQIPVNTFNKVWIMADRAEVFEHNQTAFVVDSHLKVMLEEDYLALQKHSGVIASEAKQSNSIGSQIVKQIILPELEKEVNTGKNFANLRQIFNSIILSSWYKKSLKEALLNQVYANKSKVNGVIASGAKQSREEIYEQYLKAYKKGVFNYIKEDVNTANGETIPRKYFSGGMEVGAASPAMLHVEKDTTRGYSELGSMMRTTIALVLLTTGLMFSHPKNSQAANTLPNNPPAVSAQTNGTPIINTPTLILTSNVQRAKDETNKVKRASDEEVQSWFYAILTGGFALALLVVIASDPGGGGSDGAMVAESSWNNRKTMVVTGRGKLGMGDGIDDQLDNKLQVRSINQGVVARERQRRLQEITTKPTGKNAAMSVNSKRDAFLQNIEAALSRREVGGWGIVIANKYDDIIKDWQWLTNDSSWNVGGKNGVVEGFRSGKLFIPKNKIESFRKWYEERKDNLGLISTKASNSSFRLVPVDSLRTLPDGWKEMVSAEKLPDLSAENFQNSTVDILDGGTIKEVTSDDGFFKLRALSWNAGTVWILLRPSEGVDAWTPMARVFYNGYNSGNGSNSIPAQSIADALKAMGIPDPAMTVVVGIRATSSGLKFLDDDQVQKEEFSLAVSNMSTKLTLERKSGEGYLINSLLKLKEGSARAMGGVGNIIFYQKGNNWQELVNGDEKRISGDYVKVVFMANIEYLTAQVINGTGYTIQITPVTAVSRSVKQEEVINANAAMAAEHSDEIAAKRKDVLETIRYLLFNLDDIDREIFAVTEDTNLYDLGLDYVGILDLVSKLGIPIKEVPQEGIPYSVAKVIDSVIENPSRPIIPIVIEPIKYRKDLKRMEQMLREMEGVYSPPIGKLILAYLQNLKQPGQAWETLIGIRQASGYSISRPAAQWLLDASYLTAAFDLSKKEFIELTGKLHDTPSHISGISSYLNKVSDALWKEIWLPVIPEENKREFNIVTAASANSAMTTKSKVGEIIKIPSIESHLSAWPGSRTNGKNLRSGAVFVQGSSKYFFRLFLFQDGIYMFQFHGNNDNDRDTTTVNIDIGKSYRIATRIFDVLQNDDYFKRMIQNSESLWGNGNRIKEYLTTKAQEIIFASTNTNKQTVRALRKINPRFFIAVEKGVDSGDLTKWVATQVVIIDSSAQLPMPIMRPYAESPETTLTFILRDLADKHLETAKNPLRIIKNAIALQDAAMRAMDERVKVDIGGELTLGEVKDWQYNQGLLRWDYTILILDGPSKGQRIVRDETRVFDPAMKVSTIKIITFPNGYTLDSRSPDIKEQAQYLKIIIKNISDEIAGFKANGDLSKHWILSKLMDVVWLNEERALVSELNTPEKVGQILGWQIIEAGDGGFWEGKDKGFWLNLKKDQDPKKLSEDLQKRLRAINRNVNLVLKAADSAMAVRNTSMPQLLATGLETLSKRKIEKGPQFVGAMTEPLEGGKELFPRSSSIKRVPAAVDGGIDLNTANMGMTVTKDANGGVQVNFDPAQIARIQREGIDSLSPVIFKITPVASIWPLVGLQAPAQAERLAGV